MSLLLPGDCCWALYPRKEFGGRPMYLGGHLSLKSVSKWWWRSSRIRSVKRLESCNLE